MNKFAKVFATQFPPHRLFVKIRSFLYLLRSNKSAAKTNITSGWGIVCGATKRSRCELFPTRERGWKFNAFDVQTELPLVTRRILVHNSFDSFICLLSYQTLLEQRRRILKTFDLRAKKANISIKEANERIERCSKSTIMNSKIILFERFLVEPLANSRKWKNGTFSAERGKIEKEDEDDEDESKLRRRRWGKHQSKLKRRRIRGKTRIMAAQI